MAIATCRMYAEPKINDYIEEMDVPDHVEIPMTYLDQVIPSPYGMPKYELVERWSQAEMESETYYEFEPSIDTTGKQVNAYYKIKRIISTTRRCK